MKRKKKVAAKTSSAKKTTKKKAIKKKVIKKKKPVRKPKSKPGSRTGASALRDGLALHEHYADLSKQMENLWVYAEKSEERLQDLEIHVNLLTRLFTTLCIEKFGMRVGVLKRIIKRIEKETIRDSQIDHLEFLYKLNMKPGKNRPKSPPKDDPWDQIS